MSNFMDSVQEIFEPRETIGKPSKFTHELLGGLVFFIICAIILGYAIEPPNWTEADLRADLDYIDSKRGQPYEVIKAGDAFVKKYFIDELYLSPDLDHKHLLKHEAFRQLGMDENLGVDTYISISNALEKIEGVEYVLIWAHNVDLRGYYPKNGTDLPSSMHDTKNGMYVGR